MPNLLFLKKQQNLKLSSAENYRWRFMGYLPFCFRSFQLVEMREHWDQHIYGDENKLLGYWDFHGLDGK